MFSKDVCNKIGYYVYRLVDPRNGQTFYVGKGINNRVFDHVGYAEKLLEEESDESKTEIEKILKLSTIHAIKDAGLEVIHIIQRWGMTEDEAFLVESAVMDCFPGLTNAQAGHDDEHGVINCNTLQVSLSSKEFEEPENIENFMIIKVKQSIVEDRRSRYEATRRSWKINPNEASKHPYILSVTDGIVKEIYYANKWEKVTEGILEDIGRYQFEGYVVNNKKMRDRFLNKRIPSKYSKKGMASPYLYCNKK